MAAELYPGVIALAGAALALIGGIVGAVINARSQRQIGNIAAEAATGAAKQSAEQSLIDQLQEELKRFRTATDRRLEALEHENRAYRDFIFLQRDHMETRGVTPPPWPKGLPR